MKIIESLVLNDSGALVIEMGMAKVYCCKIRCDSWTLRGLVIVMVVVMVNQHQVELAGTAGGGERGRLTTARLPLGWPAHVADRVTMGNGGELPGSTTTKASWW